MEIGKEALLVEKIGQVKILTARADAALVGTLGLTINGFNIAAGLDGDDRTALMDIALTGLCKELVAAYVDLRDNYGLTYAPEVYVVADLKLAFIARSEEASA
jgi:hypothetical protein